MGLQIFFQCVSLQAGQANWLQMETDVRGLNAGNGTTSSSESKVDLSKPSEIRRVVVGILSDFKSFLERNFMIRPRTFVDQHIEQVIISPQYININERNIFDLRILSYNLLDNYFDLHYPMNVFHEDDHFEDGGDEVEGGPYRMPEPGPVEEQIEYVEGQPDPEPEWSVEGQPEPQPDLPVDGH